MSIFESIKNAIFGAGPSPAPATATVGGSGPATAVPRTSTAPPAPSVSQPNPAAPKVDVGKVLDDLARTNGQKLNWQSSIVDLLKLLGLDSSLENRKQLASELGYTGATSDSASMNMWLHRQVMLKLEEHGGTLPPNLQH